MALLEQTSFARVGVSVDALPAILPVTITLLDERIVFRTVPGTKLAMASQGSILAVEADGYDETVGEGWSVLVRGVATELTLPSALDRARAQLAGSWIDGETAEHYVAVSCDLVTGRRLRVPDHGASTTPGVARTGEQR